MVEKIGGKRRTQQIQSAVLDTATTLAVLYICWFHTELINPWQLQWPVWCLAGLGIRGAIAFYDHLVVLLVESSGARLLPTRTADKPVRYVALDTQSIVFLTINAVHEWVFVQRLCHYLWTSPDVNKDASQIGIVNTCVALYIIFVVLDMCYAPLHHLMHMPWCYPLVHKHHHRQHFPTRGYLDAGNEHPIEHFVGILCTWTAVLAGVHLAGAHAITIFFFFNLHAALAMLNHSPFEVQWNILGLQYSVGNHEMHHRKFTVNYAQYCMWYDHLVRTFAEYEGPQAYGKAL
uniref:Fatty acid hydroxylase domain-containing protein n=1 Tax=Craspedostauros australis TaxID=1486917 RepID=A0A7R9ZNB5_9STRA|mmetsp:Transcript_19445/g.54075  ORF Transcript_19445/g.54075 Transcript_19445/m.54075 type:complete len:290 (+) Transcript_19445:256-1125(+)